MGEKWTILGQDPEILRAVWANVISWLVARLAPSYLPRLLPLCHAEDKKKIIGSEESKRTKCVSIGRPGGMEQLRVVTLKEGVATVGYNLKHFCHPPFTPSLLNGVGSLNIPPGCLLLRNEFFSVNYADCTIRWGLYESALKFVGWPIVPGFDVAGVIEETEEEGSNHDVTVEGKVLRKGDRVFGCTLFGAYSSRVLIPKNQLRKVPEGLSTLQAAALPAVSLTALYALSLAGAWPTPSKYLNKAVLIHSAAGGVGSMLVQMAKLLGFGPVVGVVGSSSKVNAAKSLGCDVVIDKSSQDLWSSAEDVAPNGFSSIFDANGVSTLQDSYDHLAPTGRLIVFGFHSNLPLGRDMLSPFQWIKMARKMSSMPKFDPMDLTVSNKSVLGFNLSFFADETELVGELFDQVLVCLENKELICPAVVEMEMSKIGEAHALIQSGQSIGKIVIRAH